MTIKARWIVLCIALYLGLAVAGTAVAHLRYGGRAGVRTWAILCAVTWGLFLAVAIFAIAKRAVARKL